MVRSIEHHFQNRKLLAGRFQSVFVQTLVDILHVHDGIIHQRTDGDSHTSQAHGIYRKAHIVQGKDGGNQ